MLSRRRRRPHPRLPDGVWLRQFDSCPFGQEDDGLNEGNVADLLHELEHVTTEPAAETVANLHLRVNVERGRFLVVEGAQPNSVAATLAQFDVLADFAELPALLAAIDKFPVGINYSAQALDSAAADGLISPRVGA